MSENEKLDQLKEMLSSELIRKRRAGIAMAVEMLASNLHWKDVRILLEDMAKNDLIGTVREDAQYALDEDDARRNPKKSASADYVFSARCPNGHVSYYDKREICPKSGIGHRRVVIRDGRESDEILLKCKTRGCGEEFAVEVDCEGYK
jgi:hypothetical protein